MEGVIDVEAAVQPRVQAGSGQARELVTEERRSKADVARRLGVANKTIGDWVQQFGAGTDRDQAEESAELKRLREENRQLRMEREILKKATAFFADPNQ